MLATLSTGALAGPPYVTDDPVPTEFGHWEIYQYAAGSGTEGATSGEAGVDLNYGGGERVQLTLVVPVARQHAAEDTHVGMGTVQLAAKYRVARQDDGALMDIALFPRVFLATAAEGLGSSDVAVLLPVWIGRASGDWYAFAGGGYQINPGRTNRDFWTGGAALTRALSEHLSMGAEVYGRTADADDARSYVGLNFGIAWEMSQHWSLLASSGPGLVHANDEGRYAFYVALQSVY